MVILRRSLIIQVISKFLKRCDLFTLWGGGGEEVILHTSKLIFEYSGVFSQKLQRPNVYDIDPYKEYVKEGSKCFI